MTSALLRHPNSDVAAAAQAPSGQRGHGLVTSEWLDALRRGRRPMPATLLVAAGCTGVWLASLATGGSLWSGSAHRPVDHALVRNAVLMAHDQWWRALSYGTLNLSLVAFVYVMALFVLAGLQVERTYGTVRYLAVLAPSWTAGALVALLVEPAAGFNAGTSGATFGVATAATIDLLRRGVPWHRTFWIPTLAIILVLGFIFPASVTWGAHVGGILAGVLVAVTLLAVPPAARYTVDHGPVLTGAPAVSQLS
jgi:membrane associated rhomboid family serine protease